MLTIKTGKKWRINTKKIAEKKDVEEKYTEYWKPEVPVHLEP